MGRDSRAHFPDDGSRDRGKSCGLPGPRRCRVGWWTGAGDAGRQRRLGGMGGGALAVGGLGWLRHLARADEGSACGARATNTTTLATSRQVHVDYQGDHGADVSPVTRVAADDLSGQEAQAGPKCYGPPQRAKGPRAKPRRPNPCSRTATDYTGLDHPQPILRHLRRLHRSTFRLRCTCTGWAVATRLPGSPSVRPGNVDSSSPHCLVMICTYARSCRA